MRSPAVGIVFDTTPERPEFADEAEVAVAAGTRHPRRELPPPKGCSGVFFKNTFLEVRSWRWSGVFVGKGRMALHEHGDFIKEKDKQMYLRLSICILVAFMYSLIGLGGEYYIYKGNQYAEEELLNQLGKELERKFKSDEVKVLELLERNKLKVQGIKGELLEQELAARMRNFRRNTIEEAFQAGLQNGKIIRSEAGRVESSTTSKPRQGSTSNQASTSARTNSTEYPSWSILLVIVAVIILGYAIYHHMAAEKESRLRARHRVRKNTRKQSDSEDEDEDEE